MLVISDTSPINYLLLVGCEEVLPKLFDSVILPSQVMDELKHPRASQLVRDWAAAPPQWIRVLHGDPTQFPLLDTGEASALSLAVSSDSLLLVDEAEATDTAHRVGVRTIGTVGVLVDAHLRSLIDFELVVAELAQTNFRISDRVIERARLALRAFRDEKKK